MESFKTLATTLYEMRPIQSYSGVRSRLTISADWGVALPPRPLHLKEHAHRAARFLFAVDDQIRPPLGGDEVLVLITRIVEEIAQVVLGVFLAFVGIDAVEQGAQLRFEVIQVLPQDFLFAVGFV